MDYADNYKSSSKLIKSQNPEIEEMNFRRGKNPEIRTKS
jgi:hypothetical protein